MFSAVSVREQTVETAEKKALGTNNLFLNLPGVSASGKQPFKDLSMRFFFFFFFSKYKSLFCDFKNNVRVRKMAVLKTTKMF